ncbi:MAG: hypothetical protein ABUT39_06905 [Acidobacteriota bacterium]
MSITFFEKPVVLPSLTGIPGLSPSPSPSLFPIQPIPPAPTGPSFADSRFVAGFKKAFSVAIDGVGIDQEHGFAKVSVKGPTVGLRKGAFSAAAGVSFTGTFKVEAKYGSVRFTGALAADRWEMTLSFPGETPVPDISSLAAVFTQGESAFRSIAASAGSFGKLQDISRIKEEVKPFIQPVTDAVTAAGGIADAQLNRLNLGISAFGPGPSPVQGISPAGNALALTLTYSF